jgi:hypothetical protein
LDTRAKKLVSVPTQRRFDGSVWRLAVLLLVVDRVEDAKKQDKIRFLPDAKLLESSLLGVVWPTLCRRDVGRYRRLEYRKSK